MHGWITRGISEGTLEGISDVIPDRVAGGLPGGFPEGVEAFLMKFPEDLVYAMLQKFLNSGIWKKKPGGSSGGIPGGRIRKVFWRKNSCGEVPGGVSGGIPERMLGETPVRTSGWNSVKISERKSEGILAGFLKIQLGLIKRRVHTTIRPTDNWPNGPIHKFLKRTADVSKI